MSAIKKNNLKIDGELVYVVELPRLKKLGSEIGNLKEFASDDLLKSASGDVQQNDDAKENADSDSQTNPPSISLTIVQEALLNVVQNISQSTPEAYQELAKDFPLKKIQEKQWFPPDKEIPAYMLSLHNALDQFDQKLKEQSVQTQGDENSNKKTDETNEGTDTLMINLGERSKITENQEFLLEKLIAREAELAEILQAAFVDDYQIVSADVAHDYGVNLGERPFLPELTDHESIRNLYQIRNIFLDPERNCIGFELETPWTTADDGPYGLSLEDFEQTTFGQQEEAWCQNG